MQCEYAIWLNIQTNKQTNKQTDKRHRNKMKIRTTVNCWPTAPYTHYSRLAGAAGPSHRVRDTQRQCVCRAIFLQCDFLHQWIFWRRYLPYCQKTSISCNYCHQVKYSRIRIIHYKAGNNARLKGQLPTSNFNANLHWKCQLSADLPTGNFHCTTRNFVDRASLVDDHEKCKQLIFRYFMVWLNKHCCENFKC